jgi:hypothetical protein
MSTFAERVVGAARLKVEIYEEVEADRRATRQALGVVVLSSLAGGIGLAGGQGPGLLVGIVSALLGWVIWATLTYFLGTKVFAEPQTRSDVGELLRTTGFAAAPGLLRVFGLIPGLDVLIPVAASVWMLVAMVIAVRQALDFTTTWRAVAVCVAGWIVTLVMIVVISRAMSLVVQ